MRWFVFNCLLLASVAVASPNGRHKRDLKYLKNLIASAIFGGSQINVQPAPVLLEENGYKLFQLPRYDDVMIQVAPKKPLVEEFVYSPAVGKINLNAFGTVVGTKSKEDTLVAVKGVNNLLSTGILYGGQNNVMKETVVPMFPSLNIPNYVVEEKIKTAPVIKTRPVFKEVIESRPVLTEVVEARPVLTEVVKPRPVLTEVVEPRPVLTEVVEPRPVRTEVVETRPVRTEVVETRPVFTDVVETRPVFTDVVETRPVFTDVVETRPVFTDVVETRPVLTEVVETRPVFTEEIRAVEENVKPIVQFNPTYSYKQILNNEPVMMYTDHNIPGVELVETIKTKTELPKCIKKKVDEAIVLGADWNRFAPVQDVFQYQSPLIVNFPYPRVEANAYVQKSFLKGVPPVQKVYQYQNPSFVDVSYPRVEANSHVQKSFLEEVPHVQKVYQYQNPSVVDVSYPRVEANSHVQNSFRKNVTKKSDVANSFGLTSQSLRPLKDNPSRSFVRNLRPTNTNAINPRPNPLNTNKSPHFEQGISASKDKVNPPTSKVQAFNNVGEKSDFPQTLGQYIALVNNRGRNSIGSNGNMKQIKAAPIVGSKDNVSNAKIPTNVYKLQRNPNTGKVVEGGDALRTNVKTTVNSGTAKNYTGQVKNVVYRNKVTAEPQSVTSPFAVASTDAPKKQPLRENIQTSNIHESTENYAYPQKNADGSSLNVNGNEGDSARDKENNNGGRGDIPDQ